MKKEGALSGATRAALVIAVALVSSVGITVLASDSAAENTQLAAVLRQLDLLERLAEQSEQVASAHSTRYHFDYARLRADLARMRSGIEDYLSPPRAQPRDLQALDGTYRREASSP